LIAYRIEKIFSATPRPHRLIAAFPRNRPAR
jgi:hypothetical protein